MSTQPPVSQAATPAGEAARDPVSPARPRSASEPAILRARDLLRQGDPEAAMQTLRSVFDENRAHAQVRSFYGLSLGLARGRYHEALDLCQSAVKQEFFNPDLYLNVARLNLAFGFKAEGLRYLRRARMIDPGNIAIDALLDDLGWRGEPVLRFLPRRHVLNRWLGTARYLLARAAPWSSRDSRDESTPDADRAAA